MRSALLILTIVAVLSLLANEAQAQTISVGDRVGVTAYGDGVAFRRTHSTSGDLIRRWGSGQEGRVIGGPVSAEGYRWWKILYNESQVGWSAEGDSRGAFFRPLTGQNTYPMMALYKAKPARLQ